MILPGRLLYNNPRGMPPNVSLNIRKFLISPFLGFLFENFKYLYVDNLELPLLQTNKQTIFLNFDICKSFVLRYLVSDEDMGKNHNPKD